MASKYPHQLTVRVSAEEKRMIERKAAAAGMSVSRYLAERGTSEEAILEAEDREEEAEALRDLRGEVNKIGSNINQIARHCNRSARVDPGPVKEAAAATEQASDAILERLTEIYG